MASRSHRSSGRRNDVTEGQKERRRELQARRRASISSLYDSLRKVVLPSAKKNPAKWKILQQAKDLIEERESLLRRLLSLKETFPMDDCGPFTLEDVREEYRNLYIFRCSHSMGQRCPGPALLEVPESNEDDTGDEPGMSQSSVSLSPTIMEFEGYLTFYRQTVELLQHSGVLSPDHMHCPAMSETILGLWRNLSPEHRATFHSCGPDLGARIQPGLPQGLSQVSSRETSGSSVSTLEEDLLQDAYEVVQRDLDLVPEDSPPVEPPEGRDLSSLMELYKEIVCSVKTQGMEKLEHTQERFLVTDYEAVFLRCTETFDDEDL